jgi:hypothetical protein
MNYVKNWKYLGKCLVVLAIVIVLRPFLDMIIILQFHLGAMLKTWLGHTGLFLMIVVEAIGIPIFLTVTVIGVLGGLWIGGKATNGFLLSLAFYLFEFTIGIATLGLKPDWITYLSFIGLLVVPAIGALIYGIFSKGCSGSGICDIKTARI